MEKNSFMPSCVCLRLFVLFSYDNLLTAKQKRVIVYACHLICVEKKLTAIFCNLQFK